MVKKTLDYTPSHKTDGKYAILMETSGEENESWYNFIRVDGNEENLNFLNEQLNQVRWYILDDLSTFDLEMDHFVSAQTAKEMTKIDLNANSFHRKFDGVLKKIDFGFRKKDKNDAKICKVFDLLGYGRIEKFIDDEDLDEEDLASEGDDSSSDDDRDTYDGSYEDGDTDTDTDTDEDEKSILDSDSDDNDSILDSSDDDKIVSKIPPSLKKRN